MRISWLSSMAVLTFVSAAAASGCEKAETAPGEAVESVSSPVASPTKLVGSWLVQARDFKNSNGTSAGLPPLDEVSLFHADGTLSGFFLEQVVGSTLTPPAANAVGGAGTWEFLGDGTVQTKFFRFVFVPIDVQGVTIQKLGYIRGTFKGTVDGGTIAGQLQLQTILVDCIGAQPCIVRPDATQGSPRVISATVTLTKFDPMDGPNLPRYAGSGAYSVGPFPSSL